MKSKVNARTRDDEHASLHFKNYQNLETLSVNKTVMKVAAIVDALRQGDVSQTLSKYTDKVMV